MSSLVIAGDTSGQVTISAPAVAGTNTATLPVATGELSMLGTSGQTRQSVTGSRSTGVTYYNTTGKPIFVATNRYAVGSFAITVDGVVAMSQATSASNGQAVFAIVPPNSSYLVSSPANAVFWSELR